MSEASISVVNGVDVTQDGDVTHFEPVEKTDRRVKDEEDCRDDRPWYQKLCDWWTGGKVTPYVKVRDLADPFGDRTDPDAGSDGVKGAEIGIKIRF